MRERTPAREGRAFASMLLSAADDWAARPLTGVTVVALAAAWVTVSAVAGFPGWLDRVVEVMVSALTLGMLFIVQHTQARLQHATQRKLDELLLAMPEASNALVRLEHGSDNELRAAGDAHRQARQAAPGTHESPEREVAAD